MAEANLGTEKYQWDLSIFYSGLDDPQIDKDVETLIEMERNFYNSYKGKLTSKLGEALKDYTEIELFSSKFVYFNLKRSLNVSDTELKAKSAQIDQKLDPAGAEYLTFFKIEIVELDDSVLEKLYKEDPIVASHRPFIEYCRIFKDNYLAEPVESALSKRASFGAGSWAEFCDELEADIRMTHRGETKTLTEALKIITNSKDALERAEILKEINDALSGTFAKYSAQTLYMFTGSKAIETKDRKYKHPMESRNKQNRVPDKAVNALHKTVTEVAGPISQRYYKLKTALLGQKILKWSDRNAPLPFSDDSVTLFDDGLKIVLEAYESFSPTLANIIHSIVKAKRIDANATKGRQGGAYNMSVVLPNNPTAFVFMNYMGSQNDIKTLAHELGHSVHGILSGEAQGPLMYGYPMAYAETASVFGELTTFNFLRKRLKEKGDKKALISSITSSIDAALNTVVRQINFSNFERRIHGMDATYTTWSEPQKNSVEDLDKIWLETTKEFYGQDGEIFTYENAEHMWSYIPHFHSPFYVYSYAFGQLLSQSLYAQQDRLGDKFEPLYLDLLRAGGTKDVIELLKPFNLDPTQEQFWIDGINVGLGALVDELEKLTEEIGIKI